jgi:3-(3-hydroxy-phenyl)propionate hydroxylase
MTIVDVLVSALDHQKGHTVPDKQVIIVGAGPVGAIAALLLAQQDIPVALYEKEAGVVLDYRASTIHPPTLDLLEPCGATAAMLSMGLQCPVMQYRDRKDGMIAEIDFGVLKNDTSHPYRLQCEQFKLTGWAYDELKNYPHAALHFEHEMTGLRQDADGVWAEFTGPGGAVRAAGRWLIGADGGRSAVRKAAGIPFEGYTHPEQFLVAGTRHDFKADMPGICSVNYTADPVEWFLLLEIPDMWRIVFPVGPDIDAEDAVADAYLQKALQNINPRQEPYELLVRAIYRVHQRVAETYRVGRVLLAGDAAHVNNPLGGVGLNGGLHDAINLTEKLGKVWRGEADDRLMEQYEAQRRPAAIDGINAMTERNKKLMEERDPAVRRANLDALRKMAADPAAAYKHALGASMIASLRETGMLPAG